MTLCHQRDLPMAQPPRKTVAERIVSRRNGGRVFNSPDVSSSDPCMPPNGQSWFVTDRRSTLVS